MHAAKQRYNEPQYNEIPDTTNKNQKAQTKYLLRYNEQIAWHATEIEGKTNKQKWKLFNPIDWIAKYCKFLSKAHYVVGVFRSEQESW